MIKANIIADSIYQGKRITTFELEYPRFIHSEFLTHRMFSRNSASSRAIPVTTMLQQVAREPAMPIHWGMNKPGMQADEELTGEALAEAKLVWKDIAGLVSGCVKALHNLGLHKQVANRPLETFQTMKTIVTATEWANWYTLRKHKDADPNIHELARVMLEAHNRSIPQELKAGEWHLPYIHCERLEGKMTYSTLDTLLTLDEARMVSASCCAQVSYRKNDDSLDKAIAIFDKLINSRPQHASPIEHQATPLVMYIDTTWGGSWPKGITHEDRDGKYWSNNFQGWIQYRALI